MRPLVRTLSLLAALVGLVAGGARAIEAADPATPSATPTPPVFLKPGEVVAPFEAEGIDGVKRNVQFPKGQVMILVFFSSGCPHCHRMLPFWNKWFAMRPPKVAMIGMLADREPPGFFESVPIAFPVLRVPSRELLDQYKVARVPLTLRIGAGGVVEEVGIGELDGIRLGQIFRP
jgi:thiol-disulfide isomerase/thioredoxin